MHVYAYMRFKGVPKRVLQQLPEFIGEKARHVYLKIIIIIIALFISTDCYINIISM